MELRHVDQQMFTNDRKCSITYDQWPAVKVCMHFAVTWSSAQQSTTLLDSVIVGKASTATVLSEGAHVWTLQRIHTTVRSKGSSCEYIHEGPSCV